MSVVSTMKIYGFSNIVRPAYILHKIADRPDTKIITTLKMDRKARNLKMVRIVIPNNIRKNYVMIVFS